MPQGEIELVEELIRETSYTFEPYLQAGVSRGGFFALVPNLEHLSWYLDGLRESETTYSPGSNILAYLEWRIRSENRDRHCDDSVGHLQDVLSQMQTANDSDSYDRLNRGFFAGNFFAPLEEYLVLFITSEKLCSAVFDFCRSEKKQGYKSFKKNACDQIQSRAVDLLSLLYERLRYLLTTYEKATDGFKPNGESLFSLAYSRWEYPKRLPNGHDVFVVIEEFRQIFLRKSATK